MESASSLALRTDGERRGLLADRAASPSTTTSSAIWDSDSTTKPSVAQGSWREAAKDALALTASIVWMAIGGFGPPWALFAVFGTACVFFAPESLGDVIGSDGYFYASVCTSFFVTGARLAVILKITYDRENALPASLDINHGQPSSYRHHWWCNYAGLALSSLFVLGDGMGRVWALVSAVDAFAFLYTAPPQLFSRIWYFALSLAIASFFGLLRLLWWVWYWFTFSQVDEDGVPTVGSSNPSAESAVRQGLRSVYPTFAYALSPKVRKVFGTAFKFPDGFGRTWAFFAMVNAIAVHLETVATPEETLIMRESYFWAAFILGSMGGLYTAFVPGTRRFKVFLHEENLLLKRKGPAAVRLRGKVDETA